MKIQVIDLFCGVGGLTKGLELAGLNVIAGFDADCTCKYAYEKNNSATFFHRDITTITSEELFNIYSNDSVKVLVGCAPCQPFSKLTKRYRKEEKERGREGDLWQKDNKWKLLYSFANLVRESLPEVVSMENVPELVKEDVFTDFVTFLTALGYQVSFEIVFCPNYGVPQNRKRLVLLASRLGKITLIPPLLLPAEYKTVKDAIGNLPPLNDGEVDYIDTLHTSAKLSELNKKRIQKSTQGGTWKDWDEKLLLACHKKKTGKGYASIYGRMSWGKPSPTITTQFYGYGNGRFGHPEQDRALSLREGALLQSFPHDYVFINPNEQFSRKTVGTHIGNAVPVALGQAIGETIMKHITSNLTNAS